MTWPSHKDKLFFQICMMDLGSDVMLLSPILLDLLLMSAWDRQKDFSKQGNGDYCGKYPNGVFSDKPSDYQ